MGGAKLSPAEMLELLGKQDLGQGMKTIGAALASVGAQSSQLNASFDELAKNMATMQAKIEADAFQSVQLPRSAHREKPVQAHEKLRIVSQTCVTNHAYKMVGEEIMTPRKFYLGTKGGCLWSHSLYTGLLMIDEKDADLVLLQDWEELYARLCLGEPVECTVVEREQDDWDKMPF